MKKIALLTALLLASTSALADWHGGYGGYRGGYGHYENHYHGGGMGWVGPALIGGVIGYELSQPRVVVQPQPQVVYQQAPVVVQQPQVITTPQPLYRKDTVYDATCNCYRDTFVQVQ